MSAPHWFFFHYISFVIFYKAYDSAIGFSFYFDHFFQPGAVIDPQMFFRSYDLIIRLHRIIQHCTDLSVFIVSVFRRAFIRITGINRFDHSSGLIIIGRQGGRRNIGGLGKSRNRAEIRGYFLQAGEIGGLFIIGINTLNVYFPNLLIMESFPVFLVLPGKQDILIVILGICCKNDQSAKRKRGEIFRA